MFLPSWLKEYCTSRHGLHGKFGGAGVPNGPPTVRPKAARFGPPGGIPLPRQARAAARDFEVLAEQRCLGTRASAEEISFCSSARASKTFRTLTFTCGGCWAQTLVTT